MMSDYSENYTVAQGRVSIDVRAFGAGSDVCLVITGGSLHHIGAIGCASGGSLTLSMNLPGHRDRDLVDIFLQELTPRFNGTLLVSAGFHLDAITPEEIRMVLDFGAGLARRIAGESVFFGGHATEKP